ncbi:MAG: hypothetical protein ACR2F2_06835 [Pyrinomonadaceae bacterium]
MIIVSDTSPVSNLILIARLDILHKILDELKNIAGFWLEAKLEKKILEQLGEN